MRKIEHIGIAVKNLQESNLLFEKLFGNPPYKEEEVASEGVKTSFFMNGPNKIELLEATHPDSPIAKFIEKTNKFRFKKYSVKKKELCKFKFSKDTKYNGSIKSYSR